MKLCKVILGLMLLCLAFTAKTSNQTHLSVKNIHQILHKSSLNSGLVSLVQMYTQNNNKGEAEDLERLNDAFELLKSTLQAKINTENEKFEADLSAHNAEVERLTDIVNDLTASVANYEYQLDTAENTLEAQQLEKSNLQSQLGSFQEQEKQASDYLVQIQETYDETVSDYGEAIELLNKAIESLEQSKLEQAGLAAFVQTNQMNFENYAVLFEKRMEKVQIKKQFFLKPIAQLFVDLQNYQGEEEIPADRIDAALLALQDLVNHLNVALVQITSNFQAEVESTQSLITQLGSSIELLLNTQIPEQQVEIEETEFLIKEIEEIVTPIRSDLRVREGELEDENASWDLRVEMHNILIPKLEGELQVVIGAQNLVNGPSSEEEFLPEPQEEQETGNDPESLPPVEEFVPELQEEQETGNDPESLPPVEEFVPELQEEQETGNDPESLPPVEVLPEDEQQQPTAEEDSGVVLQEDGASPQTTQEEQQFISKAFKSQVIKDDIKNFVIRKSQ